ncbi:hypothetical protein ACOQFO_02650 [Ureibacillus sp. MALMAid1270]
MPELPEMETYKTLLGKLLMGKRLQMLRLEGKSRLMYQLIVLLHKFQI